MLRVMLGISAFVFVALMVFSHGIHLSEGEPGLLRKGPAVGIPPELGVVGQLSAAGGGASVSAGEPGHASSSCLNYCPDLVVRSEAEVG